jgi:cobyrinic acid a,c-diamide synthase
MSAGLVIAAPASGGGKTVVTLALLQCLAARGMRVAAAKAGPDYIDGAFHKAASGLPCRNLDLWAMRPATFAGEVATLEAAAELVLCEGAMGLFDGTGDTGEEGSTAALAGATGWPVLLVVDARGQGASVAALVAGFARHSAATTLAGGILNRVGSARHAALLRAALARHLPDLAVVGVVPKHPALALPERHLGLVQAGEHEDLAGFLEAAAAVVGAAVDLDRLTGLARPSGLARAPAEPPLPPLGQRIAVARDAAFAFAYPATLAGWRRAGAALSFFSPLADEAPAPDADAVYLPGGYPELHAGRLAANARFHEGLRRAARDGAFVYGECGGYMALGQGLVDADGARHAMAGLLPLETSFAARRLHLGYRRACVAAATPLGPAGARFRGHEFHYAATLSERGAAPLFEASDPSGVTLGPSGLVRGPVAGSFLHLIDRQA